VEKRLRNCIEAHREMLSKITVKEEEVEQCFLEQIVDRVLTLNKGPPGDTQPQIKLASIDFDMKSIHQILMDHRDDGTADFLKVVLTDQIHDVTIQDGCYTEQTFVPRPHITMAHHNEATQSELKENFGHLQGCQVKAAVQGLLWNESVAAFTVAIEEATLDGKIMPLPKNAFSHITVWFVEGAKAFMSNELPSQVKSNKATCINFSEPINLTGTVAFWDMANTPLTI
jgi:hypothetical protein